VIAYNIIKVIEKSIHLINGQWVVHRVRYCHLSDRSIFMTYYMRSLLDSIPRETMSPDSVYSRDRTKNDRCDNYERDRTINYNALYIVYTIGIHFNTIENNRFMIRFSHVNRVFDGKIVESQALNYVHQPH